MSRGLGVHTRDPGPGSQHVDADKVVERYALVVLRGINEAQWQHHAEAGREGNKAGRAQNRSFNRAL
jgi:hypothetical protein